MPDITPKPADNPYVKERLDKFRAELVAWRERKAMPRREAVEGLGVTIQQLASIEVGRSQPSIAVYLLLQRKMAGAGR